MLQQLADGVLHGTSPHWEGIAYEKAQARREETAQGVRTYPVCSVEEGDPHNQEIQLTEARAESLSW